MWWLLYVYKTILEDPHSEKLVFLYIRVFFLSIENILILSALCARAFISFCRAHLNLMQSNYIYSKRVATALMFIHFFSTCTEETTECCESTDKLLIKKNYVRGCCGLFFIIISMRCALRQTHIQQDHFKMFFFFFIKSVIYGFELSNITYMYIFLGIEIMDERKNQRKMR